MLPISELNWRYRQPKSVFDIYSLPTFNRTFFIGNVVWSLKICIVHNAATFDTGVNHERVDVRGIRVRRNINEM